MFTEVIHAEQLLLIFSFIGILLHFTREMLLGNVNIVMLLLACLSIKQFMKGNTWAGSLFLGLVLLTKPFYIIILLPLLLRKKWHEIAGTAIVVLTGLLLPFLFLGFGRGLALNSDWVRTIISHNNSYPGLNSIDYILSHYLFPDMPQVVSFIIILAVCSLMGWFIYLNIRREKNLPGTPPQKNSAFLLEWFLMLAIIPSLLKTDWVQFLLSAPLIMFIIFHVSIRKKYLLIPFLLVVFFFFCANSDDLLGSDFSQVLLRMGMMGISNLILIVIAVVFSLPSRSGR